MQNKRVLIIGYYAKNLGDDLLFKTLISRYSNCDFDLFCFDYKRNVNHYYSLFRVYNINVLYLNSLKLFFYKIYRKITTRTFDCPFCNVDLRSYEAIIYIGGSIFQENGHILEKISECLNQNENIYILGCSFGPYKSKKFLFESQKILAKIKDICFRDRTSYNLFSNNVNSRVSSDVVFNLPKIDVNKNKRSIGLSVIDLKRTNSLIQFSQKYIEHLINIAKEAIKDNYIINLYSFCEGDGDLSVCEYLKHEIIQNSKNADVNIINYSDSIDEFLISFCSNSFVIATRFHAIVLSIVNNIPVYPISYMNKTDNLLLDLNYEGIYLKIQELENLDLDKNIWPLLKQQKSFQNSLANEQFMKLDLILR